jgi:hypothetical protein
VSAEADIFAALSAPIRSHVILRWSSAQPEAGQRDGAIGAYFRAGYSLSEREREIAVCIINNKWHSIYPTNAHERADKAAGLPADKVEALLSGQSVSFSDKREQVVYEMATCSQQATPKETVPGSRR